jgi:hypothetical protein
MMKVREVIWAGPVARKGAKIKACRVFLGTLEGKSHLEDQL